MPLWTSAFPSRSPCTPFQEYNHWSFLHHTPSNGNVMPSVEAWAHCRRTLGLQALTKHKLCTPWGADFCLRCQKTGYPFPRACHQGQCLGEALFQGLWKTTPAISKVFSKVQLFGSWLATSAGSKNSSGPECNPSWTLGGCLGCGIQHHHHVWTVGLPWIANAFPSTWGDPLACHPLSLPHPSKTCPNSLFQGWKDHGRLGGGAQTNLRTPGVAKKSAPCLPFPKKFLGPSKGLWFCMGWAARCWSKKLTSGLCGSCHCAACASDCKSEWFAPSCKARSAISLIRVADKMPWAHKPSNLLARADCGTFSFSKQMALLAGLLPDWCSSCQPLSLLAICWWLLFSKTKPFPKLCLFQSLAPCKHCLP